MKILIVFLLLITSCWLSDDRNELKQCYKDPEPTTSTQLYIQNPESCAKDTIYSEYVALLSGHCSGVIITPTIVLSAGHCAGNGASGWAVIAPYTQLGRQAINVIDSWSPYTPLDNNLVNADSSDISLLVMERPFLLTKYPTVQLGYSLEKAIVITVGRTNNKVVSNDLWTSVVEFHNSEFLPKHYESFDIRSQGGDSGGPAFLVGTEIVIAVYSGGNTDHNLFARTSDVSKEINSFVESHGGWFEYSSPVCPKGYSYRYKK